LEPEENKELYTLSKDAANRFYVQDQEKTCAVYLDAGNWQLHHDDDGHCFFYCLELRPLAVRYAQFALFVALG
jgi:hypothetical protein